MARRAPLRAEHLECFVGLRSRDAEFVLHVLACGLAPPICVFLNRLDEARDVRLHLRTALKEPGRPGSPTLSAALTGSRIASGSGSCCCKGSSPASMVAVGTSPDWKSRRSSRCLGAGRPSERRTVHCFAVGQLQYKDAGARKEFFLCGFSWQNSSVERRREEKGSHKVWWGLISYRY